jgi:hypothetical protein
MPGLASYQTHDPEVLLYAFKEAMTHLIKGKECNYLTDEQMDLIENHILLDAQKVLDIAEAAFHQDLSEGTKHGD